MQLFILYGTIFLITSFEGEKKHKFEWISCDYFDNVMYRIYAFYIKPSKKERKFKFGFMCVFIASKFIINYMRTIVQC